MASAALRSMRRALAAGIMLDRGVLWSTGDPDFYRPQRGWPCQ